MNRKRVAATAADAALQTEETPKSCLAADRATPDNAKKPRQDEGDPFDNDEVWNEDDLAAIDSVVAMHLQRNQQQQRPASAKTTEITKHQDSYSTSILGNIDGDDFDDYSLNDDDLAAIDISVAATMDRKPAASLPTVIVTPEKAIEGGDPNPREEDSSNRVKRRQSTLTQDFLEETTTHKEKVAPYQQYRKHDGKLESVTIRKPGSLAESTTYSKGEVWESPKYAGCAFLLGYFHVTDQEHEAEIREMWMKLDHTFIGQDRAARAKEHLGCDWVLLEDHKSIPTDRRIKVKILHRKLAHDVRKPTIYYTESRPSSLTAYFEKYGGPTIPQQNTGRPIALDIFAGGGGMSIGLERAGWNVKYKVDMNAACCETLETNFEGKSVFKEDVAKFLRKLKLGKLNIDTKNIALIHGSPPCQGFSMANTSGGKNDWQNKQCTLDFLEVIEYIQPPFVSMENVPGIVSKRKINEANTDNKSYLQTVVGKLLSMGYNVRTTMPLASHFGDPQSRQRLLLLASKDGYELPESPRHTHGVSGKDSPRLVTVHDVLHDLEEIAPNSAGDVKLNGKTVRAHFSDGAEIANISDNDIRLSSDFPLMAPDEPAKTVRKKNKFVHYSLNRYLTPLECKRLMSFPDNHVICGRNQSEIRDQIGNAVPCRFAEAIGKTIMESYCMGKYALPSNDA